MKLSPRIVAMACRCQLLTGSYEGNVRNCGCGSAHLCSFSVEERNILIDHPKVIKALERNFKEFQESQNKEKMYFGA